MLPSAPLRATFWRGTLAKILVSTTTNNRSVNTRHATQTVSQPTSSIASSTVGPASPGLPARFPVGPALTMRSPLYDGPIILYESGASEALASIFDDKVSGSP